MINQKNKAIFLVTILVFSAIFSISVTSNEVEIPTNEVTIEISMNLSKPVVEYNGLHASVYMQGSSTTTITQGAPQLPVFSHTYELPWGSTITDIVFTHEDPVKQPLDKSIKPTPTFKVLSSSVTQVSDSSNYETIDLDFFPETWYSIQKGVGLDSENERSLILTVFFYPVKYIFDEKSIEYIQNFNLEITCEKQDISEFDEDVFDLVIITPKMFTENLESLVEHKNSHNLNTTLVTTEDIYETYQGRDEAEQIKYFIKYAVETWGIKYVLLVGDIKKLPMRTTDAYPWNNYHGYGLLSDLYYADIYDENYSFCSWDVNENNIFGEIDYEGSFHNPKIIDNDSVDLYSDVNIGRLACKDKKEVDIVVNKIITYENYTYDSDWFKNIVLAGGDTFPPAKGSPFFEYEGEITNEVVIDQLPDFNHIKLWCSKRNLNAFTFNRAISKGAGFVTYAGHGFEHGWGTYRPNAIKQKMSFPDPIYYTPFVQFLKNGDKLPVIFFDACLTAKLDFNMSDLKSYYKSIRTFYKLYEFGFNPENYFPCFAWVFLIKENGGAIATIGATRPAYSWVDKDGVYAGAGYLDWMFFKNYEEGTTVGDMFRKAQNNYMNDLGKDYFTIEEYMLLGDPSLKVGGYS